VAREIRAIVDRNLLEARICFKSEQTGLVAQPVEIPEKVCRVLVSGRNSARLSDLSAADERLGAHSGKVNVVRYRQAETRLAVGVLRAPCGEYQACEAAPVILVDGEGRRDDSGGKEQGG
jgi:hypothetical protein